MKRKTQKHKNTKTLISSPLLGGNMAAIKRYPAREKEVLTVLVKDCLLEYILKTNLYMIYKPYIEGLPQGHASNKKQAKPSFKSQLST